MDLLFGQGDGVLDALLAAGWPLLASVGIPTWVWAALLMAGFAGLSILTMALARFPVRRKPPPLQPTSRPTDEDGSRQDDGR